MILGEVTNGVMRSYGTDALGSVVATYTGGALGNTYRFKPYGSLLAKTGSATDPEFMWGGGQGYRDSGLQNAGWYIRARHYSSESSQWTSCDPLYYRPGIFTAIHLGGDLVQVRHLFTCPAGPHSDLMRRGSIAI